MARLSSPFYQFFDLNGQPLANGKVYFFESNSNTLFLTTYSDANLNNANANPMILDGEGRLGSTFLDGVYNVVLKDKDGVLIEQFDPVGGDIGSRTAFSDWGSGLIYGIPAIVVGSDGKYYSSLIINNLGNDPTVSPEFWEEIRFLGVWNEFINYVVGIVVQTVDGILWRCVLDNINENPATDDGTNWLPAIDGEKIPEIAANTTKITDLSTVVDQVGGGSLIALRNNELRDASTYDLPLANSVLVDQTIIISLPDEFSAFKPTIQVSGSDTITDSTGTDTNILFDSGSVEISLTSDGVSDWSL